MHLQLAESAAWLCPIPLRTSEPTPGQMPAITDAQQWQANAHAHASPTTLKRTVSASTRECSNCCTFTASSGNGATGGACVKQAHTHTHTHSPHTRQEALRYPSWKLHQLQVQGRRVGLQAIGTRANSKDRGQTKGGGGRHVAMPRTFTNLKSRGWGRQ